MSEKLIQTPQEAIECLEANRPTNGYQMLNESLDMAIMALKLREPIEPALDKQQGLMQLYICPTCGYKILKSASTEANEIRCCCRCGQKLILGGDNTMNERKSDILVSVTPQYYLSESDKVPTGGTWAEKMPGSHLWYRCKSVLNDTEVFSEPILIENRKNKTEMSALEVLEWLKNVTDKGMYEIFGVYFADVFNCYSAEEILDRIVNYDYEAAEEKNDGSE